MNSNVLFKVRKLFTCGAFVAQTIFMLATSYTHNVAAAITCLTIAVGFGGFAWAGFRWVAHVTFEKALFTNSNSNSVNQLDIAPQYASIIMGISNTVATVPGIISPLITGYIVQNKVITHNKIKSVHENAPFFTTLNRSDGFLTILVSCFPLDGRGMAFGVHDKLDDLSVRRRLFRVHRKRETAMVGPSGGGCSIV